MNDYSHHNRMVSIALELSCRKLSQMSSEKITSFAHLLATRQPTLANVRGDLVECGVWRGASAVIMSLALARADSNLHLYDSFEGMPSPTPKDFTQGDNSVPGRVEGDGGVFGKGSLDDTSIPEVTSLLDEFEVNNYFIHPGFIKDANSFRTAPAEIAVLHIDLDFYEPYRVTLEALYDRVSPGGMIIFDDYGHFIGAKRAVDELIARTGEYLLCVDLTSRRTIIKGNK